MRRAFAAALLLVALPVFGQQTLVVGTKIAPPFVMEDGAGKLTGISIDLWEQLAEQLNLDYHYQRTDLDGLLTGLQDGSLDVAVAALTMTAARERTIDFTHPFYTGSLAVAVPEQEPVWWQTLQRFASYGFFMAVLALLGLLVAVGIIVWLFERRANADEFGGSAIRGVGHGLWWAAVTMTTVGYGDKSPRTLGGRVIGLIWMFTAVIVLSGFTAAIATSLTVGTLGGAIHSVDDLRGVHVAGVAQATSGEALTARHIAFTPAETVNAAMQELAAGHVDAVVYDAAILQYLAGNEFRERLEVLPLRFEPQELAFALPEDSPLREPFDRKILEIVNGDAWAGILARYLGPRH